MSVEPVRDGSGQMFDAIAPRYDLLNHVLSAGIDRRWRTKAIDSLRLTGHETLIDVCTGTADVATSPRRQWSTAWSRSIEASPSGCRHVDASASSKWPVTRYRPGASVGSRP